ncbi:ABC transporter substrate-binding protein [Fusobacterium sp. PH5-44]|uniref:ABC transporter substrate-binding protein n=1 Tax=unclassified Fusobacterium TaxID=2648384 RepID=UPI003D1F610D
MSKKFAQIRKVISSAFVLAVIGFGCGKEKEVNESNVKKKEKIENVLKTTISMDLDSLNPYEIVSGSSEEITLNIYEGLLMPSDNGGLKNAIAESYTISEDGLEYTLKIRKGIKFHNGNDLDIKDVEFSLNRMSGKDGSPLASSAFENIDTIKVLDENTISITLKKQNVSFIYHLTEAIVPDENKDTLSKIAIGTGPFKLTSYEKEQKIVMERFDDYWGEKAHLEKVEVLVTPNADAAFLKLISGEINFLQYVNSERVNEIKDYNIKSSSQNMVQVMALNHKFEPFKDHRVREAINIGIDKEKIIDAVMNGYGEPLETHMGPLMKELAIPKLNTKRDIEKAKELLKEAGQENLSFTIKVPSNYSVHVNTAQIVVEQLKEIGVTANIETIEWATWLDDVYSKRNYEVTIVGLTGKLDPDAVLKRYTSTYSKNFFNYNNSEYDQLITEASVTFDNEKRADLYKQAEMILRDDNAAVYIMDIHNVVALKKGFGGYVFYPLPYINFSKITIGE